MKVLKNRIFIFSFFIFNTLSYEADDNTNNLSKIVTNEAENFLKDKRFGSVSITVFHKGESYVGHYGELDYKKGNRPSDQTLYELASVTKTMTGYLVACAVNEGKFTLDTPVHEILGKEFDNLSFETEPVRIRHLITHTSGLPLNISQVSDLYEQPDINNYQKAHKILTNYTQQSLLAEVKSLRLTELPGNNYGYSNVAPNLIAHILETVYQKKFNVLLEEKLFAPAKMTSTFINLDSHNKALLANGYNDSNERMPTFKNAINLWGAAGRVKSNTNDLLNYIKWQLDEDNPVVRQSHQGLFYDVDNIWIGYYWEVIKNTSEEHIEHHGGLYGSQNWLILHPEENFGISIISNSSFPEANGLLKEAANKVYEQLIQ
ncbi:MAG: serine hydrolase domain-containing protein [Pseudohongiellaceae bacterium]